MTISDKRREPSQLKALSDFERELLRSLGETPEQHQKQIKERLAGASLKASNDTKKSLRELNSLFERKHQSREPVAETARRLESREGEKKQARIPVSIDEAVDAGWRLEALILFIQELHCRCGSVHVGLGITKPMICLHHPRDVATKLYFRTSTATKSYSSIMRKREVQLERVENCPSCFNLAAETIHPPVEATPPQQTLEEPFHAKTEVRTLAQDGSIDAGETPGGTLPPPPGPTDPGGNDKIRSPEPVLPRHLAAGPGGTQDENQATGERNVRSATEGLGGVAS